MPLNIALIGYGYAAKTFHAPLIGVVAGLRLAVVGSRSPDVVRRALPDVDVQEVTDALFSRPDIDVVVIATPSNTHFDLARRALLSGKHVVVDKPFTLTSSEAQDLVAVASASGRVLSVFHNRRWDSDFLSLRRLLGSGALGNVVYFESHFDRFRPVVRPRWREQPGPGSGLWNDIGPHLIDQTLQLFGRPRAVFADLAQQRVATALRAEAPSQEPDDYFHVLLRYDTLRVVIHASVLVPGESPRFVVHGTRGSYVKHGLDPQEAALQRGVRPGGAQWGHDPRTASVRIVSADGVREEPCESVPGNYAAFYEGVLAAITRGSPNPVPTDEALQVVEIIELGRESARTHRELSLP